jgi:hypothetical protein
MHSLTVSWDPAPEAARLREKRNIVSVHSQWFTRDEPLQGFNTQREFPRGK